MQKILFYIILFPILLSAQPRKWDAVWMLGQGAKVGDTVFVNTRLDFNHDPVRVSGTTMGSFYFFDGNVTMCNREGELMAFGCRPTTMSACRTTRTTALSRLMRPATRQRTASRQLSKTLKG